jgi:polyhydroxybutyrate depolymerase
VVLVALCALTTMAYRTLLHVDGPEAPPRAGGITRDSLIVDGRSRALLVYTPERLPPSPPLLIALHGARRSAEHMRRLTAFELERIAEREGVVVVYPEGVERTWNDCRVATAYPARKLAVDDLGFLRAIVRRMRAELGIDTSRVFAIGFSNGAQLALRVALEDPGLVRGVAVVGAALPVGDNLGCTRSGAAVPIMIVNGTDDPINPFEGGRASLFGIRDLGRVASTAATARYFADLAGHAGAPSVLRIADVAPDDGTWVEQTTWSDPARPEVTLLTVHGGGHTLPAPRATLPRIMGRTNRDVSGAELIWSFFARQAPPAAPPAGREARRPAGQVSSGYRAR